MSRALLIEMWQEAVDEREGAWATYLDAGDAGAMQTFSNAAEHVRRIKCLLGY